MGAERAHIVRPGEGDRVGNVEFLAGAGQTSRFTLAVIEKAPRSGGPQLHVHTDEDDSFLVLGGRLLFSVDGEDVVAEAGTFVLVPPGVEHTFANPFDEPARVLNVHAPGGFDLRLKAE